MRVSPKRLSTSAMSLDKNSLACVPHSSCGSDYRNLSKFESHQPVSRDASRVITTRHNQLTQGSTRVQCPRTHRLYQNPIRPVPDESARSHFVFVPIRIVRHSTGVPQDLTLLAARSVSPLVTLSFPDRPCSLSKRST